MLFTLSIYLSTLYISNTTMKETAKYVTHLINKCFCSSFMKCTNAYLSMFF